MLNHWLIDLIGHVSGLGDAQLRQIEKSLPATKALIDLLNRAQPIIEQAQSLYAEAEPLYLDVSISDPAPLHGFRLFRSELKWKLKKAFAKVCGTH